MPFRPGKALRPGGQASEANSLLYSRNLSSHTTRSPQPGSEEIPDWILLAKDPQKNHTEGQEDLFSIFIHQMFEPLVALEGYFSLGSIF